MVRMFVAIPQGCRDWELRCQGNPLPPVHGKDLNMVLTMGMEHNFRDSLLNGQAMWGDLSVTHQFGLS